MITLVDKDFLKITADIDLTALTVQIPLEVYDEELQKQIKEKPYLNKKRAIFNVFYENDQYCLLFEKGYRWDGATIPKGFRWIVGQKGDPCFLLASMVHDKLCEHHEFIKNNRYLSSLIFRELLIACGVSEFKANIMFNAVDTFQKFLWKAQTKREG